MQIVKRLYKIFVVQLTYNNLFYMNMNIQVKLCIFHLILCILKLMII